MYFKSVLMILCLISGSILSAPVGNSLDRRRIQNRNLYKGIFMSFAKFFSRENQKNKQNEDAANTVAVTNAVRIGASPPRPVFTNHRYPIRDIQ